MRKIEDIILLQWIRSAQEVLDLLVREVAARVPYVPSEDFHTLRDEVAACRRIFERIDLDLANTFDPTPDWDSESLVDSDDLLRESGYSEKTVKVVQKIVDRLDDVVVRDVEDHAS